MSKATVALAGATGNLGRPILDALLAAGHPVVVLTRIGSTSTSSLPSNPNLTIKEVDYTSTSSITPALSGVTAVISTLASMAVGDQKPLVDASLAAGVTRFIPSEFGSDTTNPKTAALPFCGGKVATHKHLETLAAANPSFTYTLFINQLFFDWGIEHAFIFNLKDHSARLYDGGARPVSTTRLSTVAQGVVGVLAHPEETKNRAVYVHDAAISTRELIDMVKKIDGKDWTTTDVDTEKVKQQAFEDLQKGQIQKAMMGFLPSAIWADGYGNDFTGKTDNDLLGIKEMSREEIEEMLRGLVQKL